MFGTIDEFVLAHARRLPKKPQALLQTPPINTAYLDEQNASAAPILKRWKTIPGRRRLQDADTIQVGNRVSYRQRVMAKSDA